MKAKKIILSILLVFWMGVIFVFSNQPANISEGQSNRVASSVIDTIATITKQEISNDRKKDIIEDTRFFVRKTAHFSLYFILNIIAYFTFRAYGIKYSLAYSILFSFLYACTDEIHQLFISERAGRIFDVFIDTFGALSSSIVIILIKFLKPKKEYQ